MCKLNRVPIREAQGYATSRDFCALFTQEMSSLYLIAFLLTGDHAKAEQCFVGGLEASLDGNPVFKQWARSWARRMIVENAIRTIAPRPHNAPVSTVAVDVEIPTEFDAMTDRDAAIANVLRFADFERFVFVMSVLEAYSDQDCSLLLSCSPLEIRDARTRAFQHIGQSYDRNVLAGSARGSRKDENLAEIALKQI
jgi:DNA-directed RNA polymerase specialized sigma24 family protein